MDIAYDDYTLTDAGSLGGMTAVSQSGKHLGTFGDFDRAIAFCRAHARREQWHGAIWYVNDHGNVTQYDYDGNVVADAADDTDTDTDSENY